MNKKITSPVLLIAFNRPETTRTVFERIREVKPLKLFVAIDGPREDKVNEDLACQEVANITYNVDWECEAKYLIRDKNLGCKYGVTRAISWVLENEDRVIIIEDDIIPEVFFFQYADELLGKYKDDERIGMISGNNYTPICSIADNYIFSKYGHISGWATWKRVWRNFDVEVPDLEEVIERDFPNNYFTVGEKKFYKKYFSKWLRKIKAKTENAWGPQFCFYRFKESLLSVVPKVNLTSNIGSNSSRTGKASEINKLNRDSYKNFTLSNGPLEVICNKKYDLYHFKNYITPPERWLNKVYDKALRILKLK